MKLTTGTLWDFLYANAKDKNIYNCIKADAQFVSVRQFPRNDGTFQPNVAYVVTYDKYDIINENWSKYKESFFIFVCQDTLEDFKIEKCKVNAIVLGNGDLNEVFTNISDVRVDFSMWTERINEALICNSPLKDLVKIGQEFIPNPFIILDVGLNLLSFTDNINEDDVSFQETIASGHTPAKLIASIMEKRGKKGNHISEKNTYMEEDDLVCPYDEISIPIKVDKRVIGVIYVHCSVVPPTKGLDDVLSYFSHKLTYYFERNPLEHQMFSTQNEEFEKFFRYLMEHDMEDEEVKMMAASFEYPVNAIFRLFAIQPKFLDGLSYTYNRILESFPQERCFIYETRIIIVSAFFWKNRKEEEHREIITNRLKRLMQEMGLYCGESRQFGHIKEIKNGYVQACKAMELGIYLGENKKTINQFEWKENSDNEVYRYNNLYLHHMIESCAKELPLRSLCMPEILNIIEYDQRKGTDNYKVLYTYLENDRVTTEAARLLHMHRNNVNYRIKRIEELFELNLSDNEERLRIQMTFRVLDFMKPDALK